MAAAAAKAAKGVLSRVRGGGAGAAAASAAARNVPRRLLCNSGKTCSSNSHGKTLHEEDRVEKLEKAMFDHKNDVRALLHAQNLKIIKLQGECDLAKIELEGERRLAKAELETMRHTVRCEVIKGQTDLLHGALFAVGAGLLLSFLFF